MSAPEHIELRVVEILRENALNHSSRALDLDAPLGELDRGAQARAAGADHEDGGREQSFDVHAIHGRKPFTITPMNTLQRDDADML